MLLSLIFDKQIKRGKFTVCANILLCVTLLTRAVSFGTALYALILLLSDNVIYTVHYSLVKEIKIFGTIPMGQLLKGVIYSSLAILMPLQLSSGLLGFLGYMCKHKGAIIVHFILLCLSMSLLVVYFVLIGGVLHEFYFNVKDNFIKEIQTGTGRAEMQSKLRCCGLTGNSNNCTGSAYTVGCWDMWSEGMHTFCSTLLSLYALDFCLEAINIIITDYRYRELRNDDDNEPSQYRNSFLRKCLPRDIIGHSCFSVITFVKREGLLEFLYRLLFITMAVSMSMVVIACCFKRMVDPAFKWTSLMSPFSLKLGRYTNTFGLGMSLLAYGAASFVECPKLSDPSIKFLTVTNSGLSLYSLVRLISGLMFSVGSLMLIGAVLSTVLACFPSITTLHAQAIILCIGILIKVVFLCSWIPLYLQTRSSIRDSLQHLFKRRNFNDAWYNFVKAYDCCGIVVNFDTVERWGEDQQLCRYENQYESKQTCSSVFDKNLDTFAKTTFSLLGITLFIEITLMVLLVLRYRRLKSTGKINNARTSIKERKQDDDETVSKSQNRRKSLAPRTNTVHPSNQESKERTQRAKKDSMLSNEEEPENNTRRASLISNEGQESVNGTRRESLISNVGQESENDTRKESLILKEGEDSEKIMRGASWLSNNGEESENKTRKESLISYEGQGLENNTSGESLISYEGQGLENNTRRESVIFSEGKGSENSTRRESLISNQRRGFGYRLGIIRDR